MPREPKKRPEDVVAIAQRMRALRATTGLSQQAFAEKYGLGYTQWGNIEAARGRIGIDAALVLARELHVPLDWIYLGEERWLYAGLRDQIREKMENPETPSRAKRITRAS
jgi:transcriptional regulator with XRE-family HTH domain